MATQQSESTERTKTHRVPARPFEPSSSDGSPCAGRVALVADHVQALTFVLTTRGYRVSTFTSRRAAEGLRAEDFDLAVVAAELEGESALELVAGLRSERGRDEFPIIVLATETEELLMRCFAAGASDCLAPEVSRAIFLAKCAHHLAAASSHSRSVPSPLPPSASGLLFDRYRVDGCLGEGSYGVVYSAVDVESGREVALKVLSATIATPEAKRRFLREVCVMARTRGPRLVSVYDSGAEGDELYYAMDRVRGPSLLEHIRCGGAIQEEEVVALIRGVAEGLEQLERVGLIHRDIKPANIILEDGDPGAPVLVDFGLAKLPLDRGVTSAGMLFGTPGYVAPEYLVSDALDARVDLFALGVVALFACLGGEPMPDLSGYALLDHMSTHALEIPDWLSLELQALLVDLTRIDRDERIGSATEVLARLDAFEA